MPATEVVFYAEDDGTSPVVDWMDNVPEQARDKLWYRVKQLETEGHKLQRPVAAYLRDGIHELRVRRQHVHYRLLYFFHEGRAVIAHGCTKEGAVDPADIERAIARRQAYASDPKRHTLP